jgi:Tfp pilus assembly protein PilN
MSTYVNLLQESEIHFRSAARDKQSLRACILGAAGVALLLLVFLLQRYFAVTGQAEELSDAWKTLEAKATLAKERDEMVRTARNRLSELHGWEDARLPMATLMDQLQALVPANAQLLSMEYRAFLYGVEGETRPAPPGPPPPAPQRWTEWTLRGLFTGTDSEQQVLDFVEVLKQAPFREHLQHVKLLETAKSLPDGRQAAGTRFTMGLQFKPRTLEWKKKS